MYLHEAMRAPDRAEFIKAMQAEIGSHTERKHWKLMRRNDVPDDQPVLDAIWSMKRKRRIKTQEVYKWKVRLNLYGGQQTYGVNFWETFAPVVTWASIGLVLILSILHGWKTRQIDFVLAYPQADVETDMYMNVPKGFKMWDTGSKSSHVLQLLKNLYGQKQSGRVWHQFIHGILIDLGYKPSSVDECIYYRDKIVFLRYIDDGIYASSKDSLIDAAIEELQERLELTDKGQLSDYLGVNVSVDDNGTFHLTQPHLIDQVLQEMSFRADTKPKPTPAPSTTILKRDLDLEDHKAHWPFRRIIGKMNFLEKCSRPELACSVHQAARFSADPKSSHTEAIQHIARYLIGTADKGIILHPNDHSFEVYADADFSGLWDKDTAMEDPSTAKSRSGYVILYAGCPILWTSRLQSETALSTTEAEYLSLSSALRETIPLMKLVKEFKKELLLPMATTPVVHCKAFEDNSGAVELARVPKMRPRTKHINTKYHHFRKYVSDGLIKVQQVATADQIADILTKNLCRVLFIKFRRLISGW
jgi:hypothetical protein